MKSRIAKSWNLFWHAKTSSFPLAVFRVVHGATLLLFLSAWWQSAPEWLTEKGFHFSNDLIRPLPSASLPILFVLQFSALLLLITGWNVHLSALVSFACLAVVTLVDRIAAYSINSIFLFTLAVLSVYGAPNGKLQTIAGTPIRLLQVALITIYFSSGWHKAVFGDWLDSPTTLWTTTQGVFMTIPAAWAVDHIPLPFWTGLQYAVLAFELFSPVLFFGRRTWFFAIAAGCVFHIGIALFMDKLIFFSLQMMSFYVLFLPSAVLGKRCRFLRRMGE